MTERDSLFDTFQNAIVSAIALHGFVLGYNNIAKNKPGKTIFPPLPYVFFVLPIVYNYRAMEVFKSSNQLYMVLIKDKAVILGLQERAIKMTSQTFEALNVAFSKNILDINNRTGLIELKKGYAAKKLPLPLKMNNVDNRVKQIQDCAFKLGGIFAKRSLRNIQFELNIKI